MGEEFYSIIKLVSGEEIFSLVSIDENDEEPIIILQNPIIMKMFTNSTGSHIKVKPWIELSKEDFFMIRSDKIITMTESRDQQLIQIYNDFIKDDEEIIEIHSSTGYTKPSATMGYISSVKDARKKLESLFNKNINSKES
tara:strand:- start:319 stop:738 length:420 start_codon:yes stop_codon:yes gene_type:complete